MSDLNTNTQIHKYSFGQSPSRWFMEEKHTSDMARNSAYLVQTFKLCYTLKVAINEGVRQGRHPVSQDYRVASLDQNPQSPPEVPNCLAFLLASVTVPRPPQASLPPSLPPRASHQMKGLPSSSHIVPIGIVVKVAHRPSLAVVHSGLNTLNTLPSTSPPG